MSYSGNHEADWYDDQRDPITSEPEPEDTYRNSDRPADDFLPAQPGRMTFLDHRIELAREKRNDRLLVKLLQQRLETGMDLDQRAFDRAEIRIVNEVLKWEEMFVRVEGRIL